MTLFAAVILNAVKDPVLLCREAAQNLGLRVSPLVEGVASRRFDNWILRCAQDDEGLI